MKRLYLCLGVLAGIIILSVYSLITVHKGNENLSAMIDEIQLAYNNGDESTVEKISDFEEYWLNYYITLSFIADTGRIDDISFSVARLKDLYTNDSDEFISECESIRYCSYLIYTSEYPHLYSII